MTPFELDIHDLIAIMISEYLKHQFLMIGVLRSLESGQNIVHDKPFEVHIGHKTNSTPAVTNVRAMDTMTMSWILLSILY